MINDTIFNIFSFLPFSFGYPLDLVLRAIFFKFGQNTGFVKYSKTKKLKTKKLKCYYHTGFVKYSKTKI